MMLAARDEHGDALTDTEIRDQVLTFWAAGTETTAALLAWSLHLLAQYPHVARRLQTEVDAVLGGRVAGYDDVARLDYTTRVLTETLRLYPPELDILPGAHHRGHPGRQDTARRHRPDLQPLPDPPAGGDLYPDPDHFDPDRWLPEHTTTLPRGAFIPFGGGARKCIGDTFAMLEASPRPSHHHHPLAHSTPSPRTTRPTPESAPPSDPTHSVCNYTTAISLGKLHRITRDNSPAQLRRT